MVQPTGPKPSRYPDAILQVISTFLSPKDMANAALVDTLFHRIFKDNQTWFLAAKNLNLSKSFDRNKDYRAMVTNYYKEANAFMEAFLKEIAFYPEVASAPRDMFERFQYFQQLFTLKKNKFPKLLNALVETGSHQVLLNNLLDTYIHHDPQPEDVLSFNISTLELLFKKGFKFDPKSVVHAIKVVDSKKLALLLKNKVPIPAEALGLALLMGIGALGSEDTVRMLINHGIKPTRENFYRDLHFSAPQEIWELCEAHYPYTIGERSSLLSENSILLTFIKKEIPAKELQERASRFRTISDEAQSTYSQNIQLLKYIARRDEASECSLIAFIRQFQDKPEYEKLIILLIQTDAQMNASRPGFRWSVTNLRALGLNDNSVSLFVKYGLMNK